VDVVLDAALVVLVAGLVALVAYASGRRAVTSTDDTQPNVGE
jgi:hypothetical protein